MGIDIDISLTILSLLVVSVFINSELHTHSHLRLDLALDSIITFLSTFIDLCIESDSTTEITTFITEILLIHTSLKQFHQFSSHYFLSLSSSNGLASGVDIVLSGVLVSQFRVVASLDLLSVTHLDHVLSTRLHDTVFSFKTLLFDRLESLELLRSVIFHL